MTGPEGRRTPTEAQGESLPRPKSPVKPTLSEAQGGLPKGDVFVAPQEEKLSPKDVRSRNEAIWEEDYKRGRQSDALSKAVSLYGVAERSGVSPEILAGIKATESWSAFSLDMKGGTKLDRAYLSANEGLSKIKGREGREASFVRSRLLQVAGLTQAYLVEERDEPAKPLLKRSVDEAKKSEDKARIGEAKNGYALWFISNSQKDKEGKIPQGNLEEAISLFEEVADIQGKAGNKKGELNARSNLCKSYYELGELDKSAGELDKSAGELDKSAEEFHKSIEEADKAIALDNGEDLGITLSIHFRKSLPHEGLGKYDEAEGIFRDNMLRIIKYPGLSEDEIRKKFQQQDDNIRKMRERQKALEKKSD